MKELVIFGLGQIAEIACFYFQHDSQYKVAAFTADSEFIKSSQYQGLPVVNFSQLDEMYPPDKYDLFIAISYAQLNHLREKKFNEALEKGYFMPNYISSKATVWSDLSRSMNCFILEDNTIQPFVKIGNNVTLWSGNHIGHHSSIEDHCFISSHVVISGGVTVGKNSFLGVNSTIRDHVIIAPDNIIGMGAVLSKNTNPGDVYKSKSSELAGIKSDCVKL